MRLEMAYATFRFPPGIHEIASRSLKGASVRIVQQIADYENEAEQWQQLTRLGVVPRI